MAALVQKQKTHLMPPFKGSGLDLPLIGLDWTSGRRFHRTVQIRGFPKDDGIVRCGKVGRWPQSEAWSCVGLVFCLYSFSIDRFFFVLLVGLYGLGGTTEREFCLLDFVFVSFVLGVFVPSDSCLLGG